jgi:hypothetical protein
MKGSKKYASHEYSFTKGAASGLGKNLEQHKSEAHASRQNSRTFPAKKMSDGGSIQSGISQAASQGGVPHTTPAGSTLGAIQAMGSAFGSKAKGGEVKKHDAKNLKELDGSMRKFFKEEAQEKTNGGEVKAEKPEQKATHKGDSKKDDKIPILASEGEAVIKKSIMKSKDAPEKAAKVVKNIKAKKGENSVDKDEDDEGE